MIETILFDADGMIIKREEYFSERFAKEQGIDSNLIQVFFRKEWNSIVTGKTDLKEVILPYLRQWGWNKSVEEYLEYWFISEKHLDQYVWQSIESLKLKGIACYLATNQEKYRLKFISEEMKFGELFDGLYSSCDIGFKKPSKEYFRYILNDLEISDPKKVLFWDDTPANVISAKELGILGAVYKDFESYTKVMEQYGF